MRLISVSILAAALLSGCKRASDTKQLTSVNTEEVVVESEKDMGPVSPSTSNVVVLVKVKPCSESTSNVVSPAVSSPMDAGRDLEVSNVSSLESLTGEELNNVVHSEETPEIASSLNPTSEVIQSDTGSEAVQGAAAGNPYTKRLTSMRTEEVLEEFEDMPPLEESSVSQSVNKDECETTPVDDIRKTPQTSALADSDAESHGGNANTNLEEPVQSPTWFSQAQSIYTYFFGQPKN